MISAPPQAIRSVEFKGLIQRDRSEPITLFGTAPPPRLDRPYSWIRSVGAGWGAEPHGTGPTDERGRIGGRVTLHPIAVDENSLTD